MQFGWPVSEGFEVIQWQFGSPVLATSVELVQAETELLSLKSDVMMTADRCSNFKF